MADRRLRAPRTRLRPYAGLIALCALAALVRFWRIGHQSLWLDESFTHNLVAGSFGDMLRAIPRTESTPPLYYLLAWLWAELFGTGAAGLRSLSALIGVATVPVVYATARRLFAERRVALVAAALVAVNPYFVWYSQEARSYALLVLIGALSVLATVAVLERPSPRPLAAWALVAVLALLTHYFAAFLLLPEAVALLRRSRSRAVWAAVAAPLACAAALAPLALHQRSSGHTQFIAGIAISTRLRDLPRKFVTGELGLPLPAIGTLAGVIVAAALVAALTRTRGDERRAVGLLLALAAAATAIPLVLALAGADYLLARNVIALYVPLALAVAAGLALGGRTGLAATAALCLTALVVNAYVAYDARVQRDDWRGAARALANADRPSAVVLTPAVQQPPFALYAGPLVPLAAPTAVSEVDAIGAARPARFAEPPAPPGFLAVARKRTASYLLIRYRAAAPILVTPTLLAASRLGTKPPAILLRGAQPR